MKLTKNQLEKLANNITNLTREFNTREGIDPSTDTLPESLLDQPNKEGSVLTKSDLDTMIYEYNLIRGQKDENSHS